MALKQNNSLKNFLNNFGNFFMFEKKIRLIFEKKIEKIWK